MNIILRKIDRSNYEDCIALQVLEKQKNFVAENWYSLLQSLYEPNVYTLAIYDDTLMVGMFLYDYDEDIKGWSMSRFMIDQNFQHKGYGKLALQAFLTFFYQEVGNVDLYTSAEVDNEVAIHVYSSFNFDKLEEFSYEHKGSVYHEVRMVRRATNNKGE